MTGELCGADGIADAIGHAAGWTVNRRPAGWYDPCDPEACRHGARRVEAATGRDWCPAAGPRRNAAMVAEVADRARQTGAPHIVLGFPIAKSPGTRGCLTLARAAGLTTRVIEGAA